MVYLTGYPDITGECRKLPDIFFRESGDGFELLIQIIVLIALKLSLMSQHFCLFQHLLFHLLYITSHLKVPSSNQRSSSSNIIVLSTQSTFIFDLSQRLSLFATNDFALFYSTLSSYTNQRINNNINIALVSGREICHPLARSEKE